MHHVWGLPVALDLFFAGLGAGLFLVAVMADLLGGERYRPVRRVGGILAPWPVILGVILLIADLGKPQRFWEFVIRADLSSPYLNYLPGSVMSTGTWLLVIFTILSLGYFLFSLIRWPFKGDELVRRVIGLAALPFGLLVTIYTGVLIAGTSIPLWNTPMLPLLFVSSAVLAGVALIALVLGLRPVLGLVPTGEPVMKSLLMGQAALAVLVLVLSFIFVGLAPATEGASWALWWVFVVVLGLVVPLIYGIVAPRVRAPLATPVVAFLAVLGAFFLRYAILMNGQVM
jgi:formate-dependent nitrite reductase membrane component NrfD